MRWHARKTFGPGDTRVIHRFLFWPRTINGETRGLEFAYILQEHLSPCFSGMGGPTSYPSKWADKAWSDPPTSWG